MSYFTHLSFLVKPALAILGQALLKTHNPSKKSINTVFMPLSFVNGISAARVADKKIGTKKVMRYFLFILCVLTSLISTANITPTLSSKTIIAEVVSPSLNDVSQAEMWQYITQKSSMRFSDDSIDNYINWFQKRPDYLTRISTRAQWYIYYIVKEVQKLGLPIELALLPIVESAFYPFSYSPEQAAGLWQFIPSTGRTYGLTQNWWYDARRDVVASTKAALQYLTNLSILFDGDWLLAIAAYNAGPGRVQKEIKKNKAAGLPTNFWFLSLPPETRSYVPKLLAVLEIIRHQVSYNQVLHPIANKPRITKINLDSQLDVKTISELSGLSVRLIYELNPGLRRWTTPPMEDYQLLLPVDVAAEFIKKLAKLPLFKQLEWVRYKLKKGEDIADIARNYNISKKQLEQINTIGGFDPKKGNFLIIPIIKESVSFHTLDNNKQQQRLTKQRTRKDLSYLIKPGDSLLRIALLHHVSMSNLMLWNDITDSNKVRVGQVLNIKQPNKIDNILAEKIINTKVIITRKIIYRIKKNDTLSGLARRFSVSIASIKKWNKLKDYKIKYGENLVLYINIIE